MANLKDEKLPANGIRRIKRLLTSAATIYLGVVLIMCLLENSMIYPAPKYPAGYWEMKPNRIEDAVFTAKDGTKLHGWFIDHNQPRGTVLYFHGNGENVSMLSPLLEQLNDTYQLRVLALDYRGYGKSEGKPNEKGIYQDSRAALRWLNERTNTTPNDIIMFGRSIGGGVAVELAAGEGCQALVLENTFTSLPDAAAEHFPWLPVRLVMRNRYPSVDRIARCQQPLLQSHGTADEVVPFDLGKRLFEASPSTDKQFLKFEGLGHNDPTSSRFWQAFERLLEATARNSEKSL